MPHDRVRARRNHLLVGRYFNSRRGKRVFSEDSKYNEKANRYQYISPDFDSERYARPSEAMIERRYNEKSNERYRGYGLDELLQRLFLSPWTCIDAALKEPGIVSPQVQRNDRCRSNKDK
jgi:hypothetical protein